MPTRDYAIAGKFGNSVSITDGEWILHQSPVESNSPLYWYGHCLAHFHVLKYELGPYEDERREVIDYKSWPERTWLSDKRTDANELINIADNNPKKLAELQTTMRKKLIELKAPPEQLQRLGL